jgi:hypothetical protein
VTLLANDLPKTGGFKDMPTWHDLGQLWAA